MVWLDNNNKVLGEILDKVIDDISSEAAVDESRDDISSEAAADESIDGNIEDCFSEFLLSSVNYGVKDGKKLAYFPCDTCKRKQVIAEQYNKVCNRHYIPPYVDPECGDYKLLLILERIEGDIVEKIFKYLVFRISIRDIVCAIVDPEWRRQAEDILRIEGYSSFIQNSFGCFNKKQIIEMLFDINYCFFDSTFSRNLDKKECIYMLKYYIVLTIRTRIKESFFRIVKLIELELEYKIAVIEGEIRYVIKCILQEIAITPLPASNYNITHFDKLGTLTELLKIFNGVEGGKHDERSDFRHIRDTIRKYEKVVRTTLDLLNKKIKEYETLIGQRTFIVGVTGICERPSVFPKNEESEDKMIVPPQPVVIIGSGEKKEEND